MTIAPWLLVTRAQLKQGWVEKNGQWLIPREYVVIRDFGDGTVAVRNPELEIAEKTLKSVPR